MYIYIKNIWIKLTIKLKDCVVVGKIADTQYRKALRVNAQRATS